MVVVSYFRSEIELRNAPLIREARHPQIVGQMGFVRFGRAAGIFNPACQLPNKRILNGVLRADENPERRLNLAISSIQRGKLPLTSETERAKIGRRGRVAQW